MNLAPNIVPLLGAGAIFLVVLGVFAMLGRRSTGDGDVGGRLEQFAGREQVRSTEETQAKAFAGVDESITRGKRGSQIAASLGRADIKLRVIEFIGIKLLAAVLGGLFGAVVGRASPEAMYLSALVGAIVLSFVPDIYVNVAAKRRVKAFNNQLGDSISMLANALRSGYSFLQAMDLVSREAPVPTANEFRRVVQEVGLGLATEKALENLLKRVPSDDLDLMVTAVNIQHEVGGNLAQILETIGHTIRERVRIKGEIQTLTAQGRISGYVITALPFALAVMITLLNPEYMQPMFTVGLPPKAWCCLPVASTIMIAIGYYAIMKIVDIEV